MGGKEMSDAQMERLWAQMERALEDDVLRVSAELQPRPVSPGPPSESGIKHGSVVDAVVVVTEALTNETIRDAVKKWCKGGSDREAVVARFGEIGAWDVRPVTSFRKLFFGQKHFNEAISSWETLNVTDMHMTFCNAYRFNHPLESWNTAKVTNMEAMFNCAASFDQPLEGWNTANVTTMSSMFAGAPCRK